MAMVQRLDRQPIAGRTRRPDGQNVPLMTACPRKDIAATSSRLVKRVPKPSADNVRARGEPTSANALDPNRTPRRQMRIAEATASVEQARYAFVARGAGNRLRQELRDRDDADVPRRFHGFGRKDRIRDDQRLELRVGDT